MEQVGRSDENIENKRKRLVFRSSHRGIKEMDLIMGSFAVQNVPNFTVEELAEYDELLCNNDPDLYNWLSRKETPPAEVASMSVFAKLLEHKFV